MWARPHQAGDALLADVQTGLAQIAQQSRRPVGAIGADRPCPDGDQHLSIPLGTRRGRALAPRIEAAGGDPQHATHRRDGVDGLVVPHEPVDRGDAAGIVPVSRANQAVAFDRISRSSFT